MLLIPSKNAQAATKYTTITYGSSTSQYRSSVTNIPNLKSVVSLTSSTGTPSYTISGNNVTTSVNGGSATGSVYDAYKYASTGYDYQTSMSNNLPSYEYYNDGTYSGYIYGNGVGTSTVQTGGSYTPADTKYVTASHSDWVQYYDIWSGSGTGWLYGDAIGSSDDGYYSDSDGYSGTLSFITVVSSHYVDSYPSSPVIGQEYMVQTLYFDNVTFGGNVTRPESDTRTYGTQYSQSYSGTVYAAGYDPTYSYTLTLGYTDNSTPTAPTITAPTSGQAVSTHTPSIAWNFNDPDAGDSQRYYQVMVSNNNWVSTYYDTGQTLSGTSSATLPYLSTGSWQIKVRDWDQVADTPSPWASSSFSVNPDKAPPTTPIATNITANSVILTSSAGSNITNNGQTKVSGSTWSGLSVFTTYTAFAFNPADASFCQSANSASVSYTTLAVTVTKPGVVSLSGAAPVGDPNPTFAPTSAIQVEFGTAGYVNSAAIYLRQVGQSDKLIGTVVVTPDANGNSLTTAQVTLPSSLIVNLSATIYIRGTNTSVPITVTSSSS